MRRARAIWSRIMKVPSERSRLIGLEERVNHRQTVGEHVGQRDRQQITGAAPRNGTVGTAAAILHHAGLDVAVFHHHRVVEHRHVDHAAVAMPGVEVGAENRILFRRRHRDPHFTDDIGIAVEDAPHVAGRPEFVDQDADRNAGSARLAGRSIGN